MTVPTRGGPVRPREESRAGPASADPAAMPVLKAEVVSDEVRVGASPAKRMARAVTTGLTVKPVRPMRKTRRVAVTGLPDSGIIRSRTRAVAAAAVIVVAI